MKQPKRKSCKSFGGFSVLGLLHFHFLFSYCKPKERALFETKPHSVRLQA